MNEAAIVSGESCWPAVSSRRAKRRGDFSECAAHQNRWSHAYHLVKGPRQMRGVREIGSVRRIRNGTLRADGDHGSRQLAPQHIPAERKSELFFEEMRETA